MPLVSNNVVSSPSTVSGSNSALNAPSKPNQPTTKQAFQEAVAGMIFGEMIKAMRSTTKQPAYIGGGQGEKMFQSQLDQQISEQIAKTQGAPFADRLYQRFEAGLKARAQNMAINSAGSEPSPQFTSSASVAEVLQPLQQAKSAQQVAAGATGTEGLISLHRR